MGYYKDALEEIGVLTSKSFEKVFTLYFYGFKSDDYVKDHSFSNQVDFSFYEYNHIHKIAPNIYGFINDSKKTDLNTLDYGNCGNVSYAVKKMIPLMETDEIKIKFIINGEPMYLRNVSENCEWYCSFKVVGCLKNKPDWMQNLYESYVFKKENNMKDCFSKLFIAFEGMLREQLDDEKSSIHQLYKKFTNTHLPDYLNAYREIRNEILHGENTLVKHLRKQDIKQFVAVIYSLYAMLKPIDESQIKYTDAIKMSLKKIDNKKQNIN